LILPSAVPRDGSLDSTVVLAATDYLQAARELRAGSYWPLLMFTSANMFLWHIDAFNRDEDPVPLFVDAFKSATALLKNASDKDVFGDYAHLAPEVDETEDDFEGLVSGLFSDIWVEMSDDIYFEQSYEFTKARLEKSGVDPVALFKDKVIVDAGCGGGEFTTVLARFGAAKVIGFDIGEKGLDFARKQAEKVSYKDRLDYRYGSLLNIPLGDNSVDLVWSNGVIHHTLGYEKCLAEFSRILKVGGELFLYVNGRFGLWELLFDTLRLSVESVPRDLFQHFLVSLGFNTGRIYWMMDCLYASYEWKPRTEVESLLRRHGFTELRQLVRGVPSDQIEMISEGLPYASIKYGEGQLKFLCVKR